MKSQKPIRVALIVAAILAVIGLALLFYFGFEKLVVFILLAALVIGLIWIGAYYLVRWLQRRKQKKFDAGVAAREGIDDRKARVVKCRYFLGLTVAETAQVLEVSTRTVEADWELAKAWLRAEMNDS